MINLIRRSYPCPFSIVIKQYSAQVKDKGVMSSIVKRALILLPERFTVCKLPCEKVVLSNLKAPFFLSSSNGEITLLTETDRIPHTSVVREDGWRALRIEGEISFEEFGVLFRLLQPFAKNNISVLVQSTHSTDYVFFKEHLLPIVKKVVGPKYKIIDNVSSNSNA